MHRHANRLKIYTKEEWYNLMKTLSKTPITDAGSQPSNPASGDLRVHIHTSGIQAWVLRETEPSNSIRFVWAPAEPGEFHPRLQGYRLSRGGLVDCEMTWVRGDTKKKYEKEQKKEEVKKAQKGRGGRNKAASKV